jgi:hypothetical protein
LLLWFSFNVTFDQYGTGISRPWLATALFAASIATFYFAGGKSRGGG